jgi:hypothetical protein
LTRWSSAPPPEPGAADHTRGEGPVVIEYADLECPYCAKAHLILKELPITRVFRHFPVTSKHPRARVLAAAAEAAGLQGKFWEMHDSLLEDQGHLDDPHLWERAERLGLDIDRFERDRRSPEVGERIDADFRSGSPTRASRTQASRRLSSGGFARVERVRNGTYLDVPPTGGG